MSKEFAPRRLDVKSFAEHGQMIKGELPVHQHERLMAETQGRGAKLPVTWEATGELRNAGHVNPEIWLHLQAQALLPLTCQRCLGPVDVEVAVDRLFRFVADEEVAASQDDQSEEDLLAMSHSFDLVELIEDEILMSLPLAPRHESCPLPAKMSATDEGVEAIPKKRENAFAILGKLKIGKP